MPMGPYNSHIRFCVSNSKIFTSIFLTKSKTKNNKKIYLLHFSDVRIRATPSLRSFKVYLYGMIYYPCLGGTLAVKVMILVYVGN